ncbi:MAG: hypothetical protein AAB502_05440 [Chloroflexota bacterium]
MKLSFATRHGNGRSLRSWFDKLTMSGGVTPLALSLSKGERSFSAQRPVCYNPNRSAYE